MAYNPLDTVNGQKNLVKNNMSKMYSPIVTGSKIKKSDEANKLEKSGEGTRGGKVIGHTKSGKAIYDTNSPLPIEGRAGLRSDFNKKHKEFTSQDHKDAAEAHDKQHEQQGQEWEKHYKSVSGDEWNNDKNEKGKAAIAGTKEAGKEQEKHATLSRWHNEAAKDKDSAPDGSFGKTRSGKNIGTHHSNEAHKDFDAEDHLDAFQAHNSERNNERDAISAKHGEDKKAAQKEINNSVKVNYHSGEMQKHLDSYGAAKGIKKSEQVALNNMLEKGEIADCLANGYGAGSEPVTFVKTGKEIKEKIPVIKNSLNTQISSVGAQLSALVVKIGFEPTNDSSRRYDKNTPFKRYDWGKAETPYVNGQYGEPTEENINCSKYNALVYLWNEMKDDFDAISVMENNLEDAKKYTLSVSQLIALNFN